MSIEHDLINSLDEIAFENGPSDTKKLESIQNQLYQYSQIKDAMSIQLEEYYLDESRYESNDTIPPLEETYRGEENNTPNMRRV